MHRPDRLTKTPPRGCPPLPDGAWYDPELADRFIRFCSKILRHPAGPLTGQPFVPAEWQEFEMLRPLYGYVRWDEQFAQWVPQYSIVWLEVARGGGKTGIMAAIGVFELVSPEDGMPRVFSAALDRDQAGLVYEPMAAMVRAAPALDNELHVRDHVKQIDCPRNNGRYRVLAGDPDGNLGLNPTCTLFDEIVSQASRGLYDALSTGAGKRVHSKMVMGTTAGSNPASFAKHEHDQAMRLIEDPALIPHRLNIVHGIKPGQDEGSEEAWRAANPAIAAGYFSIDTYRKEYKEALIDPTKMLAFRIFRLNDWASVGSEYVPMGLWNAAGGEIDVSDFIGRRCWGGLDLSSTSDLTSLCWCFDDPETPGGVVLLWRHWCAQGAVKALADATGGLFPAWIDAGWCDLSHLNVIDYDQVHEALKADIARFDVAEIGFDQWNIGATRAKLEDWEVEYKALSQGGPLSGASEEVLRLLNGGLLRHAADPVAAWSMSCATVVYDANQRLKVIRPPKQERSRRIDPTMAGIMAVDRWAAASNAPGPPRFKPRIISIG